MKMKQLSPARAAWAETELARLPVEAHDTVSKPNSIAFEMATDTTRSLYEKVGWLTESSLTQSSFTPRTAAEALGAHQRREARVQADVRLALDGQQLAVAPQVARPALDDLAREHAPDGVVVVLHLQRTEAGLADVQGGDGRLGAALAAPEPFGVAHLAMLLCVMGY